MCRVEALYEVYAVFDDFFELLVGLYAFSQHLDAVHPGKLDGVLYEHLLVGVVLDVADQVMVKLYDLRPVPEQVDDIGMSRTVIIYRKYRMLSVYIDAPEFLEFLVFYGVRLGHLEYECAQVLAVFLDQFVQVGFRQEMSRYSIYEYLFVTELFLIFYVILYDICQRGFFHIIQPVGVFRDLEYVER